jgi:hypothetical protein
MVQQLRDNGIAQGASRIIFITISQMKIRDLCGHENICNPVVSAWKWVVAGVAELTPSDNANNMRATFEQQEFVNVCAV